MQLSCRRGIYEIFTDISLEVKAGTALTLRGKNGAGKTSLLRLIAGLLRPYKGEITFTGSTNLAAQCHYIGHQDGLKPQLNVWQTMQFFAAIFQSKADKTEIKSAIDKGGLGAFHESRVSDLSAGQKRRLSLARLWLAPRQIWLLDEPLTALDAQGKKRLHDQATAHLAAGGILIAASHETLRFAPDEFHLD